MKSMPKEIKQKLRQLHKAHVKSRELEAEVQLLFDEYNVDTNDFRAIGNGEVQTEALAYISNAEGGIEDSIKQIEEVFLYYVNKD